MNGTQYVTRAMKIIGAIDPGRPPTSAEAEDGLDTLNHMCEAWGLSQSLTWTDAIYRAKFPSSKLSYTIGPGGDLATDVGGGAIPRPVDIFNPNLVWTATSPAVHIPITKLQTNEWLGIAVPLISSNIPIRCYYDQGFVSTPGANGALASAGVGTIFMNPYPSAPLPDLEWSQRVQFVAFDLTTDYNFPPGYAQALELSLAEKLLIMAPPGVDKEEIKAQARDARALIVGPNGAPPRLVPDLRSGNGNRTYFNWLNGNLT